MSDEGVVTGGRKVVGWILLAQERLTCRSIMNTLRNIWFYETGECNV